MNRQRIRQYISFTMCLLMMVAAVVSRNNKLLGHSLEKEDAPAVETLRTDADSIVVNTTAIAKDVMGYGGPTPVEITLKGGKVAGVRALENSESADFFSSVLESGLLQKWNGLSLDEAILLKVDGVSGATFSSKAIIDNVQRGLNYAKNEKVQAGLDWSKLLAPKTLVALIVVLMGALIPLWVKDKRYRPMQLVLNVCVLGFWCGTFVSHSLILNGLANGMSLSTALIPILLLIVAFIYPLFGKKNHYCTWLCPFGSLQELIGRRVTYKVKISPALSKNLTLAREILWGVLMFLMWTGLFFEWTDYEPFAAFMFREASVAVLVIAVCFLLLSAVVMRPYCRFVCPTGTLMKMAEDVK